MLSVGSYISFKISFLNFVRKNSRRGLTPADKVGIGVQGNKWETMLLNSIKKYDTKINKDKYPYLGMKSIKELRNPDIIEINGEKYQVVEHSDGLYNSKKDDLGMIIGLVKVGEKTLSPRYYLEYLSKNPKKVRFFIQDKEQKIKSIKL